ncbi:MAG: alpha/beta hydrolase [Alphaproteobacteria bacterium]|jgi:haloacetate dehalogenase
MSEQQLAVIANGIRQHLRVAGKGQPLVLLHGWPQTSYSWRKVIPALAEHYSVIAPDLRGMGHTDKPASGYDMRTVATDIRALVHELGLERPYIVGADWGGLVARRYALDWPGEAARYLIVDIVPHEQIFADFRPEYARAAWHYFFNAVPDMPEKLVAHDVEAFLRGMMAPKYFNPAHLEEAIDEYVRAYSVNGALRGGFAYYKAMFEENRALDRESAGQTISDPIRCVWGNHGGMGGPFDVLAMWRPDAPSVVGQGLDHCGHYIAEEAPEALVKEIISFDS